LQAIIVVGDIDVDQIEQKIKALWADVPARENRGERPLYSVDDNEEPIVAIVRDKEAQNTRIELEFKQDKLPKELRGTDAAYIQAGMLDLICDMLNNRFTELSVDPKASFTAAGSYYGETVKEKDAFVAVYIAMQILVIWLDLIAKLPILSGINKTAGAALGGIQAMVYIWIFCLFIGLISGIEIGGLAMNQIVASPWLSWIYNHNVLSYLVLGLIQAIW
jgi:hypothetical protein